MRDINNVASDKYRRLLALLEEMGSMVVAFSGGVDSTLVAMAALSSLGDKALAVTAVSPTLPAIELASARRTSERIGIRFVELPVDELSSEGFASNTPYRCYYCKRLRMAELQRYARERAFEHVVDGANADDLKDWRPGLMANEELGIESPLIEAGVTKEEARDILKNAGIPTWNKPSSPCLASRFPYGMRITATKLAQVEAGEEIIRALGIEDLRVRHLGETARIEVPESDFEKVLKASDLMERFKRIGFNSVLLDPEGLRSGRLNDPLMLKQAQPTGS